MLLQNCQSLFFLSVGKDEGAKAMKKLPLTKRFEPLQPIVKYHVYQKNHNEASILIVFVDILQRLTVM